MADSTTQVGNTVTVNNASTFDSTQTTANVATALVMDRAGRIVFTDKFGNIVKSRQRTLKLLYEKLHKEQWNANTVPYDVITVSNS